MLGERRGWAVVAVAAAAALALGGCSANNPPEPTLAADLTAAVPSWLTSAGAADGMLTGTADRPALSTEGEQVLVKTQSGSVVATMVGPEVPGEGLPHVTESTTCTWTITLSGATAPIAIAVSDFSASDHLGHVYPLALVAGQPVPPDRLSPGQAISFEVRAVMDTGEGLMRWAPGGKNLVASWDFVVEND